MSDQHKASLGEKNDSLYRHLESKQKPIRPKPYVHQPIFGLPNQPKRHLTNINKFELLQAEYNQRWCIGTIAVLSALLLILIAFDVGHLMELRSFPSIAAKDWLESYVMFSYIGTVAMGIALQFGWTVPSNSTKSQTNAIVLIRLAPILQGTGFIILPIIFVILGVFDYKDGAGEVVYSVGLAREGSTVLMSSTGIIIANVLAMIAVLISWICTLHVVGITGLFKMVWYATIGLIITIAAGMIFEKITDN
jgi:hypothetical protein